MKKINDLLKRQVSLIRPEKEVVKKIKKISKDFVVDIEGKLKKRKVDADVFIGGSLAKGTIVKKDKYDIDIFVRFGGRYRDNEISSILGEVLGKGAKKIHGSRDYYRSLIDGIVLEVIPVLKIKKPEEALNVTDLSYFHVSYVAGKIKENKKLSDEIALAKSFCFSQGVYGAESYINGFSGYAIELLICHYKSFLNFVKEIVKSDIKKKIIIDDGKFYKKKEDVIREVNEAKLNSPIILIDPTFKERNVLACLSYESYEKFRKTCAEFLKNPSDEFFIKRDVFLELREKYGKDLRIVGIKTTKQKGDIAGTKSKKFYNFFLRELKKEFIVKVSEFSYDEEKNVAYVYFLIDKKANEVIRGPPILNRKAVEGFERAHPGVFVENGFVYFELKHELSLEEFFDKFLKKYEKIIKEMDIKKVFLLS